MPGFLKSDLADLENHNNPRLIKYINYSMKTLRRFWNIRKPKSYEDYQRIKDNYDS